MSNIDDKDLFSNDFENYDDKDLFSYDNTNNIADGQGDSFDLNSFSSKSVAQEEDKKKKKSKFNKTAFTKILLSVFLVGFITVSLVVGCFLFYAFTMVDGTMDEDLNNLKLNFTTTIYVDGGDGEYEEYRRLHGEFNRIWVDYDKVAIKNNDAAYEGIPQTLADAFVAIEDRRFFEHEGVDWKRTFGAFVNEFVPIYSSRQGGSTITQQLVKNLTDDRSQKASRKVREIMRARYVESKYSKDTILECYLNTIPMGHGTYGVEVAANYYFGKSVKDLSLVECASLAAVTKGPSYYSPDDNPENNKKRRNQVLYEMYDQGYISKKEYEEAKNTELKVVAEERVLSQNQVNSYFVDALIEQVVEDLCKKYGYDKSHANQLFYNSGYKIYATVDPDIQKTAEAAFSDSSYAVKGKNNELLTAGITVMDYKGNVKAIVGGFGEKTTNRNFNAATDAIRQPGSTMKPIAAYAPAIEKDLITYSTIVNDTKTSYNGWTPNNWYGGYWGNITVQYALERSVNTIPVYLVNKMKPQTSFDFLTQKLGITTLNSQDVNLSPLGMGGTNGGITTLESAAAFAVFGNGGLYYQPSFYTKITDQDGQIVLEREKTPKVAISEDTATIMNHLLQTVVYGENGTGKVAASYVTNMKVFAKTGTSNDQNDLWFVGGSPYYVASCWCGFPTQQPVPKGSSGVAKKLWGTVMSKANAGLKVKDFTDSSYTVERFYCANTGELATDACPNKVIGWYKKSNLPKPCSAHSGKVLEDTKLPENSTGETASNSDQGGTTE